MAWRDVSNKIDQGSEAKAVEGFTHMLGTKSNELVVRVVRV